MLVELLVAAVIALLVTALISAVTGTGGWGGEAAALFLIAFLIIWASGVWVTPFGPAFWDGYWLTFLVPGLLLLLLFAALLAPNRRPRTPQEAVDQARADDVAAGVAAVAVGVFFWILILALLALILAAYV
jgi:hypothetical protein